MSRERMKNYLSFGGGVNSVAMMLLLLDEGVEFEAVYVWMPDWPETHEYLMMLEDKGYPITVIFPRVKGKGQIFTNLYNYSWEHKMFPVRHPRWCTVKFKVTTLNNYFTKPSFILLGIDAGESHRAALSSVDGIENRYPLIERELTRKHCVDIIRAHNLPIPIKSGCYICPNQRIDQIKQLRRKHPDLFCKLVNLEKRKIANDIELGKELYYTMGKPFTRIVNEPDTYLFEELSYPPCQCGL